METSLLQQIREMWNEHKVYDIKDGTKPIEKLDVLKLKQLLDDGEFLNPSILSERFNAESTEEIQNTLDSLLGEEYTAAKVKQLLDLDIGYGDEPLYFKRGPESEKHIKQWRSFTTDSKVRDVIGDLAFGTAFSDGNIYYRFMAIQKAYNELRNHYPEFFPDEKEMRFSRMGLVFRVRNFFDSTLITASYFHRFIGLKRRETKEEYKKLLQTFEDNPDLQFNKDMHNICIGLYNDMYIYGLNKKDADNPDKLVENVIKRFRRPEEDSLSRLYETWASLAKYNMKYKTQKSTT